MNNVIDFDESLNQGDEYDERFDCDYSSIDEVINKVEIFTSSRMVRGQAVQLSLQVAKN